MLAIPNGGTFTNGWAVGVLVDNLPGALGTVTAGAGSTWTNTGNPHGRRQWRGHADNPDGGTVNSAGGGAIGLGGRLGGSVTVIVPGPEEQRSRRSVSRHRQFGYGHAYDCGRRDGQQWHRLQHIGNSAGSQGTVTVIGPGSIWTNSSGLNIGNSGTGTLTVANGGIVSGPVVIATNGGSIGTLNIGAGASSPAVAPGTLTAPNVAFGAGTGTLNFNHTSTNYVFAPAISGNGTVNVLAGTTTLTGANSYSGATNVNAGTLQAGAPNTFSPNSAVTVASGGTLDLNGFSQAVSGVTNAGLVNMGTGTAPGTVLTTTSYTGTGGTIAMNTFLGGDGSPSDKLVINGGTATGMTGLLIHNAAGPGLETTANGILVVNAISGATTAPGAFTLGNPGTARGRLRLSTVSRRHQRQPAQ